METFIYIDVIFFLEWGMNFFLLWVIGKVCGLYRKLWRIILGGFLSSLFHFFWILFFFPKQGGIVLSLFLLILAIETTYFPKNINHFIKLLMVSLGTSFLLGGALNVLFIMTQTQKFLGSGLIIENTTFPWYYLLWAIMVSYLLIKWGDKWIETHIRKRKEFCTICLKNKGAWAEGYTLIDTGNGLKREGKGVIIMEFSTLLPLFSLTEIEEILEGERKNLIPLEFTSLGNVEGGLWGIQVEECSIRFGAKKITYKNIFVGINFDGFVGGYEGLTPPCLLEEE